MYLLLNDIEQEVEDAPHTNAAFQSRKPLVQLFFVTPQIVKQ